MKLPLLHSITIRLSWVWILVFIMTGINMAHAESIQNHKNPFDIKIDYCLNQDQVKTIQDAIGCKYLPRKELPRGSLSESTVWIRLQIDQSKTSHPVWVVQIGPHFLGEIEFYEKTENGWQKQIGGSKTPFADSQATLGGYVFEVMPSAAEVQTVYFQVKMSGLGLILINVAPLDHAGFDALSQQLGIGIHIGAILLILAFSIFNYLMHPGALMFRFCCLTVLLLLNILGGSGLLAKYVFIQQTWLDSVFFNWMICLRLACWVWVAQAFLAQYQTPVWYKVGCRAIYLIVSISLVLVVTEKIVWLQHLLIIGFIATTLIQIIAIQKTIGIQKNYRNTLLLGYIVSSILVFITILLAAYPIDAGYTIVYATRIVDFVTPIVLLIIVGFRNRLMHKEFDEVKTANILMNTRLEYERKLLNERRVLFDMLTHELKNPLASIALAVGSLKRHFSEDHPQEQRRIHNVDQSIRNMDLIIERCSLMNQVDQNEIAPNMREIEAVGIIQSLLEERSDQERFLLESGRCLPVLGDEYFFRIIISNLLENAIKYSPPESIVDVKVSAEWEGDVRFLKIVILNSIGSHGVPDSNFVFTRFYRNPLAQNITGSGLGLHLVKELCKILDYSVRCDVDSEHVAFSIETPASMR